MARYETVRERIVRFGANGYFEVARKRLVEDGETTKFVLLSHGFLDPHGARRWTRFVTIPDDPGVLHALVEALEEAGGLGKVL